MRGQGRRQKRIKTPARSAQALPSRDATWWMPWAFALGLAAITVLVFARTLTQDFVFLDDDYNVYQNPHLSPAIQIAPFWHGAYFDQYCPLTYTAYALIARFARLATPMPDTGSTLDPHVFHAATLALHAINVALVFFLVRMLLALRSLPMSWRTDLAAALGALLFALHPLQVESVAWVTDLQRVLCATFSLLSTVMYLRAVLRPTEAPRARWAYYGGALALGLAAVLCKPSAVSLPLMLLVLDRWFAGRSWRDCFLFTLPWFVVILPLVWFNHHAEPPLPLGVFTPYWTRPFQAGDTLAFYLAKLFAPVSLAIDYGRTPHAVTSHWWGYVTWLLPATVTGLVFALQRGRPWLVGACLLSLVVLLPVLGLVPITFAQFSIPSDRYVYLALVGPAILVAFGLATVPRPAAITACIAVLMTLAVLTIRQVRVWDNSETLFRHALAVNPNDPIGHYDLGNLYHARGDNDAAIPEYRAATVSLADWEDAHINLAAALMEQGDYAQAAQEFETSLKIRPNDAVAREYLDKAKVLMEPSPPPEAGGVR